MEQIYHPYHKWEDWQNGMWRNVFGIERDNLLRKAIKFTGNAKLYGKYMLKVILLWPNSCEHNLTNPSINHQAFIGHCACCMAIGCPEDITRQAWHQLTQKQQDKANLEADKAIALWQQNYSRRKQCQNGQLVLVS